MRMLVGLMLSQRSLKLSSFLKFFFFFLFILRDFHYSVFQLADLLLCIIIIILLILSSVFLKFQLLCFSALFVSSLYILILC